MEMQDYNYVSRRRLQQQQRSNHHDSLLTGYYDSTATTTTAQTTTTGDKHFNNRDGYVQSSNYHPPIIPFDPALHRETYETFHDEPHHHHVENRSLSSYPSSHHQQQLCHNSLSGPSFSRSLRTQTPRRSLQNICNDTPPLHKNASMVRNTVQDQNNDEPTRILSSYPQIFSYGLWCCQCVRTQEVGVTENCGRFQDLLEPGLHCLFWPIEDIAARISLRICQLDIIVETKTADNVFVKAVATLFYKVNVLRSYDAFYRLADPRAQITSYVFDVIRSTVPKMTLDELFESKNDIAHEVNDKLSHVMMEYGYQIVHVILTEVRPTDDSVIDAMNEMNASQRLKEAMQHRAYANKIRIIKEAEAQAETSYLSGVGVSNERKAIAQGLKENIIQCSGPISTKDVLSEKKEEDFESEVMSSKNVINLLVLSSYMDCMAQISSKGNKGQNMTLEHGLSTVQHLVGQVERLQLCPTVKK